MYRIVKSRDDTCSEYTGLVTSAGDELLNLLLSNQSLDWYTMHGNHVTVGLRVGRQARYTGEVMEEHVICNESCCTYEAGKEVFQGV